MFLLASINEAPEEQELPCFEMMCQKFQQQRRQSQWSSDFLESSQFFDTVLHFVTLFLHQHFLNIETCEKLEMTGPSATILSFGSLLEQGEFSNRHVLHHMALALTGVLKSKEAASTAVSETLRQWILEKLELILGNIAKLDLPIHEMTCQYWPVEIKG